MKRTLIITILQLTCLLASGQSLFDMYLKLPEQAALGDKKTRDQMVANYKNGIKTLGNDIAYRFDIVDEKNGFLTVTGAMEGSWEMCYWNLANGTKLVAVYFQACGPVCDIENFAFYHLQGGKMIEQKMEDVIPGYATIYQDFFINYAKDSKKLEEQDIVATLLFKLPRKGKDIVALFGNEDSKETYSKFSKGDRMLLKWNNGKFIKDKIYWSE